MEREEMPVDVLFVGAGPACLLGSIHLMNLIEAHNQAVQSGEKEGEVLDEPFVALLEKGSEVGAHQLSGAVIDPRALAEVIPDWKDKGFPAARWTEREEFVYLRSPTGKVKAPWIPPELVNHGKPIASLGQVCKWLAEIAEEKGVNIFPGFAGADLLWDGDTCVGVRTGDKGIGPDGQPKDTYEPGMDLPAQVTILGEGPRGHLARKLIERRQLDKDSNPMVYELGCKELIEMPEGSVKEGFVVHGVGWPVPEDTFGGFFLYAMEGDQYCLGLLMALDGGNPNMDVHHHLQQLKTHPYIKDILGGGKVVKYGAKAVTIGGWSSIPKLYTDGAMIVGDSASFLNPLKIKGIHLSMKSGMLAAEAAFEALVKGDASDETLSTYKARVDDSWIREEMEFSKNMHANFENGFFSGLIKTGAQYLFGPGETKVMHPDFSHMRKDSPEEALDPVEHDGKYLVDKLTDVYMSGTTHEEQQPAHLKIVDTEVCATTCKEEYGNPCTRFCPAQVYNMVLNEESGREEMQVDFSNCVHCKTCDIRDPYQIITWVPPEGGNGPEYHQM